METIREVHAAEKGLAVVDVASADEATALAVQTALAGRWATAVADRATRTPGEPGVRLRCYLDLRQEVGPALHPCRAVSGEVPASSSAGVLEVPASGYTV
ncbi:MULTISPECIES: DUF6207 family protein [Streptomyces]|uniref:DUF6207 family protein n=1 Tax=Streptomyces TaxID=1883 RepID=UPI00240CFAF6|nr:MULTISPECIES: DUF6207 family protein [Streptomyces]WGK50728.1 DUF6207 family protein [Streptomyces sp. B146]